MKAKIHKLIVPVLTAAILLSGCPGPADPDSDDQLLLAACAMTSACIYQLRDGMGACYDLYSGYGDFNLRSETTAVQTMKTHLRCLQDAQDCDAIAACSQTSEEQNAGCAAADVSSYCDGDVAVYCGFRGSQASFIDCAESGHICVDDRGEAACGLGRCEFYGSLPECTSADVLTLCHPSGALIQLDCRYQSNYLHLGPVASHSETCGMGPEGVAACMGGGEECATGQFDDYCEGDIQVSCYATGQFDDYCEGDIQVSCYGGRVSRVDCSEVYPGTTCVSNDAGRTSCDIAAGECDLTMDEECNDGIITYCKSGRIDTMDCIEHGFAGCDTSVHQHGERIVAFCRL
jgi:hypothetical protein